jgi:uncharacterized membrane protein YeaQ/YmgE (transglycosylase-associated protein family)
MCGLRSGAWCGVSIYQHANPAPIGAKEISEACDEHGVGAFVSLVEPVSKGVSMSIIAWIILGLIAGFIASKIVNREGQGFLLDIVLGVVGAVVGGWLMAFFGHEGVTGFNLYSVLVAIGGAIVVLVVAHAVRRAV